jgi:hypothetical protein
MNHSSQDLGFESGDFESMSFRSGVLDSHTLCPHSTSLQCLLIVGLYGALLFLLLDCEYPGILFMVHLSAFVCGRSLLALLGWKSSMMPQAIRVVPASRFANHVIELAHTLHYCTLVGVRIVDIDRIFYA